MPIFKVGNKTFYFAHVPKCGGSNVEVALMQAGVSLSFIDRQYWKNASAKWGKSSPQHISSDQFYYLFDDKLFDEFFCVVRDPVRRFLSAYNHNRKRIGRHVSFDRFLNKIEARKDFYSIKYDNHFVPASRLIPNKCNVFYLENGLNELNKWLNKVTNVELNLLFNNKNERYYDVYKSKNKIDTFFKKLIYSQSPKFEDIDRNTVDRIKKLYWEDYERFEFE